MGSDHAPFEPLLDQLSTAGWGVVPNFLTIEETRALAAAAKELEDQFRPAGIGRGESLQVDPKIRSDLIHWVGEDETPAAVKATLARLEDLKTTLNRGLYLGLKEFEGHFALYPPGAAYEKHVDNFRDVSPRAVSCVLYLNDDWRAGDAGELRLFDRADAGAIVAEIPPKGGTLACFLSREIPHEVLPTQRNRLSFTGWFRDR